MRSIKMPKMIECVLIVLSLYYILFDVQMPVLMPAQMSEPIIVVLGSMLCLFLFLYAHPILAILVSWIVVNYAYKHQFVTSSLTSFNNSFGSSTLSPHNQFPYTLEQEMVKKMAPIPQKKEYAQPATYKPSLDSVYDGEPLAVALV